MKCQNCHQSSISDANDEVKEGLKSSGLSGRIVLHLKKERIDKTASENSEHRPLQIMLD